MHHHAALSGCTAQLVPKAPTVPNPSRETSNGPSSKPSSNGAYASRVSCGLGELLPAAKLRLTSVQRMSAVPVSRPLLGFTLRGQTGARRLGALLLRLRRPSGYGFQLRRTLRKCRAWHLGAGFTRSASPGVTRAGYGKFN